MSKIIKKCNYCNEKFYSWPSQNRIFCSRKCKDAKHSLIMKNRESYKKGKTWEELYGKEKSNKLKENKSKNMLGNNNPMFNKQHTIETKLKISQAISGENNPMYNKKRNLEFRKKMSILLTNNNPVYMEGVIDKIIQTKSKNGKYNYKQGYYKDEYYHSSYELNLMKELDNMKNVVWSKKHKHKIPYIDENNKWRYYIPDFVVHGHELNKPIIWETKGILTKNDILKALAAKIYCKIYGYEYLLTTKNFNKIELNNIGELL